MNNILQPRERIILQKYIKAESIRQIKSIDHSVICESKREPIIRFQANTRMINDLEQNVIEA